MTIKDQDLENPDNWNLDSAEIKPPVRNRRAIVSVALPSDDFQLISKCAQALGMKLSEFLRTAAIEKCQPDNRITEVVFTGSSVQGNVVLQTKLAGLTRAAWGDSVPAFIRT